MKIELTPSGGAATALVDHTTMGVSGWNVMPLRNVEVVSFVQSAFGLARDKGSTVHQMVFSVTTVHADYAAAQMHMALLGTRIPSSGALRFEAEDQHSYFLAPRATIEVKPSPIVGVKTVENYIIKFGEITEAVGYVNMRDANGDLVLTADGRQTKVKDVII